MSVEELLGKSLRYHLVAFDAEGSERPQDGALISQRVAELLANEPITDVFLMSHGWMADVPAARRQYDRWIDAMVSNEADIERIRQVRSEFRPLLIGLHWSSLPWGDEELGTEETSFEPTSAPPLEALVAEYAERIADTAVARQALRTILQAALEDIAPTQLPADVRDAYSLLDREASLGAEGVGAAPGADRKPFDPERLFQAAEAEPASFGDFSLGGLLAPLRALSFWKMKDRARRVGESGGFPLLHDLQAAASDDVRFHLVGHSFGCIVVSAMLTGPQNARTPARPVSSLALLQGALSLWSYCADIPVASGRPGYFYRLVEDGKVAGPIITTQSEFDTAVGRLYPLAAGVAQHVDYAPGELPAYGALGTFGARGSGFRVVDMSMLPCDADYDLRPGHVYNLESSNFICELSGGLAGAHSDTAKPEVAHAVWSAAAASGSRHRRAGSR